MAKKDWKNKEIADDAEEMSLEEAAAFRASLYKEEEKTLSEEEKREEFRLFWAREKYKYGSSKDLEPVLWAHLKSSKMDEPKQFEDGLKHFGLKKI